MAEGKLRHDFEELLVEVPTIISVRKVQKELKTKGILLFHVVEMHD